MPHRGLLTVELRRAVLEWNAEPSFASLERDLPPPSKQQTATENGSGGATGISNINPAFNAGDFPYSIQNLHFKSFGS